MVHVCLKSGTELCLNLLPYMESIRKGEHGITFMAEEGTYYAPYDSISYYVIENESNKSNEQKPVNPFYVIAPNTGV